MKFEIGDTVVSDERFETESALVDRYVEEQARRGRLVPAYELTALLAAVAGFLAQYLATKALDHVADELATRDDSASETPSRSAEDRQLSAVVESARAGSGETAEILPILTRLDARLVVRLETPAEATLLAELQRQLPGVTILAVAGDQAVQGLRQCAAAATVSGGEGDKNPSERPVAIAAQCDSNLELLVRRRLSAPSLVVRPGEDPPDNQEP